MIPSDNHVHTSFSTDSDTPMTAMTERAIQLGLPSICFTDHIDYGFPSKEHKVEFLFPMDDYFATIKKIAANYPKIPIRTGVELGLKKDILSLATTLTKEYPFDFVIGSTHLVDNIDPYYSEYWESYGEAEGIRRYYEVTYENICGGFDFDVYGHIDYIIRYCPTMKRARENNEINEAFCQQVMKENHELLDEILLTLIQNCRGIEVNTGGLKYKLGHPNPHEAIISRYHKLGGKLLTIGSDAHEPQYLAYSFDKILPMLYQCGFSSYTEFHKRCPVQIPFE